MNEHRAAAPALERFERAAAELRDAARSLAGSGITGMDALDRLGGAVSTVHGALDVVRQLGGAGDPITDE